MIQLVSGDILLTQAQAMAHGVAPFDHFNQGLALALREQWPAMVKDFRHWCHNQNPKPGEVWQWVGAGGHRIFNELPTTRGSPAWLFLVWRPEWEVWNGARSRN
ncbi:MAG: hypothetical protein LW697_04265 [Blastopirellula sp.]|nr:hypothetical protein [Blastopirellula sp.]